MKKKRPFALLAEGCRLQAAGRDRGGFALLSDALSSLLVSSGREGEPLPGSRCGRCALSPLVSQVQLCPCPVNLLSGTGAAVPVWTARSESCSVWLWAGRCVPPGSSCAGTPKAKHHAGIWTCAPGLASAPSPWLFLLPMSLVFEVKVKRANVPDLSDIIICSGRLLGINKINLTTENKTKTGERKGEGKKEAPEPLGGSAVRGGFCLSVGGDPGRHRGQVWAGGLRGTHKRCAR